MDLILRHAIAVTCLGVLGCGAPKPIAEPPRPRTPSPDPSCDQCREDCQVRQYGTSLQQRFRHQGGLLNVGLRIKHSAEEMRAFLAPIDGRVECLDAPEFAPRLAGQSCYVVRLPLDRCYSEARQLLSQRVPGVSSIEMPVPEHLCSCTNWSESLYRAATPAHSP